MVLYFMAIISANLAAINLLPIPLLDGGHLFHYIIEAVIRRDLSLKYQKYAATFGATILFLLMAVAITNDIRHLFKIHMKKLFHILIIIFISFPTLLVALENKEKYR